MTPDVDCVVLGAGVIGLACARELAMAGHDVLVAEAEAMPGAGISSRNSEVIHAGIYYPRHSLKARLCVRGKHLLYDYCAERGIAHRRLGKWIVATEEAQLATLESIARQAQRNGVHDLVRLTPEQIRAQEPELRCVAALASPSTGIVDSHGLMLALQADAANHGAEFVFNTPFIEGHMSDDGLFVLQFGGSDPARITSRRVVNAAGLHAPDVARRLAGQAAASIPPAYYCKGSYFMLSGRAPFSRLIYPLPDAAGLGVHLTLDLAGQARFGPDVQWVAHPDYTFDAGRAPLFERAIRQYWPGLPDKALLPGYTGIRPKIAAAGRPAADFLIAGPSVHGADRLVNLFGIESPGLTASLAIAQAARLAIAPGA
ncbi:NAD(P)/FAD-dependent oxidoreductase [Pusillimonas caeni]|uniref:NAD(P)/FAD-dependent oxidoreductase n=1 Tax=Pusillimonas caeni TaxID=1348472 RepID=UPI000E59D4F3|nr:NAD(P)/FAD-dependent oxidoreductase [Pusillimonas caeni]TFL13111.1 NAD(P)/FAD-dependent oxidoreductase [Pusillimonas caeni]